MERTNVELSRLYVIPLVISLVAAVGQATVTVSAPGKERTSNSITSCEVTITVTIGVPGTDSNAPTERPSYTLDLYDKDIRYHDAKGVDQRGGPDDGNGWTNTRVVSMVCGSSTIYSYVWTVPCTTLSASDVGSAPDPYIEVVVTGPGGGTVTVAAPDLPPVSLSNVDLGCYGESHISNCAGLWGRPIAGLSRGYDQIQGLGGGASLYFVSDRQTQQITGDLPSNPGQAFVLNLEGDLWCEEAYGGDDYDYDPSWVLQSIKYLNVNTAAAGQAEATPEMYLVGEDSDIIEYASDGDVENTSVFLDLQRSTSVSAIAVKDGGTRGVWDGGDLVLFAEEGSAAIYRLSCGGIAEYLEMGGYVFDGSTTISLDYLDDGGGDPAPTLTVGNILSLSVAGAGAPPVPNDRIVVDCFDVPEPATLGMLALGGLALIRRRRK